MKNECLMTAIIVTTGAVLAFFAMLAKVTRTGYLQGFAEGFAEARRRFLKVIKAAKAEKLFKGLLDDIDDGS